MFIIFDLDGTLALTEHRQHLVSGEKKDWDAFFEACDQDEPCWPVIEVARALLFVGHRIEIWSGRSDAVASKTLKWISATGILGVHVQMRPAGDFTPDEQLKEKWLLEAERKPDMVFDDRAKVVAMWRRHGIVCAQVAPGEF